MPKQKTHKGAAARLSISGSGKVLRRKVGVNNFRRKKSRAAKGQIDEMMEVHPSVSKRLSKLLPYGRNKR
jgi:large subunit ribosomal protein L35